MKKFVFNLESVLDYRLVKEEKAKQKLGLANFKAAQQKQMLSSYQNTLLAEQDNMVPLVDISLLQHKDLYVHALCQQIEDQKALVRQAEQEVERRQQEATKAMQDTMVLDNLKAKRYQEYLLEADKLEQKLLDEIGLVGFMRQKSENS